MKRLSMKKRLFTFSIAALLLTACQDDETTIPVDPPSSSVVNTAIPEPTHAPSQQTEPETTTDGHTAQYALDWAGSYSGIFPCADCEGLETNLTLNEDGSYALEQTYLGKETTSHHSTGNFSWGEDGSVITLNDEAEPNHYFVAENELFKLDSAGQQITGELADLYTLTKR